MAAELKNASQAVDYSTQDFATPVDARLAAVGFDLADATANSNSQSGGVAKSRVIEDVCDSFSHLSVSSAPNNSADDSTSKIDPIVVAIASQPRDWHEEYTVLLDQLWALHPTSSDGPMSPRGGALLSPRGAVGMLSPRRVSLSAKIGPDELRILSKITGLADEFCERSKQIARVIVTELHAPKESKTVQPIDATGDRFVAHSIVFQRVSDSQGIYGSEENAAKAAANQRRGMHVYAAATSELRTPLLSTIDYRGVRFVATAQVSGLGKHAPVYGSADGGRTVNSESDIARSMAKIGTQIGLKSHMVGPAGKTTLSAPVDIQVHRIHHADGKNRFYVLDTARVFPPTRPDTADRAVFIPSDSKAELQDVSVTLPASRQWSSAHEAVARAALKLDQSALIEVIRLNTGSLLIHGTGQGENKRASFLCGRSIQGPALHIRPRSGQFLSNVFRPEFLQHYRKQAGTLLSSDAFSGFGSHNQQEHNSEVAEATLYLVDVLLRKLAEEISTGRVLAFSGRQICDVMHQRGINLRYLSKLRDAIPAAKSQERRVILTEMVTRLVKSYLRSQLRSVQSANDNAAKAAAAKVFNAVFGKGEASDLFWTVLAPIGLREKFGATLSSQRTEFPAGLRGALNVQELLVSVQQRSGVVLSAKANLKFAQEGSSSAEPFACQDVDLLSVQDKRVYWDHHHLWEALQANYLPSPALFPSASAPPIWSSHVPPPPLASRPLQPPSAAALLNDAALHFGRDRVETAMASLCLSSSLLQSWEREGDEPSDLSKALIAFENGWSVLKNQLSDGDARVAVQFLSARILFGVAKARLSAAKGAASLPLVTFEIAYDAFIQCWEAALVAFGRASQAAETGDHSHPIFLVLCQCIGLAGEQCQPKRTVPHSVLVEAAHCYRALPPPTNADLRKRVFGAKGQLVVEQPIEEFKSDKGTWWESAQEQHLSNLRRALIDLGDSPALRYFGAESKLQALSEADQTTVLERFRDAELKAWAGAIEHVFDVNSAFRGVTFISQLVHVANN